MYTIFLLFFPMILTNWIAIRSVILRQRPPKPIYTLDFFFHDFCDIPSDFPIGSNSFQVVDA